MPREIPFEEWFWSQVDRSGECWVWIGRRYPTGYGWVPKARGSYAHRAAFTMAHGPIPKGMHICHRCDNPPCVRQDHLFLGTPSDNMRDRDTKGRDRFSKIRAAEGSPALVANSDGTISVPLMNAAGAVVVYALIDATDRDLMKNRSWHVASPGRGQRRRYANSSSGYMHHLILPIGNGQEVVHLNGDGLDNRRANLARMTHVERLLRFPTLPTAQLLPKYVYFDPGTGKWRAEIRRSGRKHSLGYHFERDAALETVRRWRIEHGEIAITPSDP